MRKSAENLFKKLEANIEERKMFKDAFAPALDQIGKCVNDGHVVINMDLAKVLLLYIDGANRHYDELSKIIEAEKVKNIPAIERR